MIVLSFAGSVVEYSGGKDVLLDLSWVEDLSLSLSEVEDRLLEEEVLSFKGTVATIDCVDVEKSTDELMSLSLSSVKPQQSAKTGFRAKLGILETKAS